MLTPPPPTPGNASASDNAIPPRRQGSGETFLSRFDVAATNGHAEATSPAVSAAVSATALNTLSDMLRSRSPGVVKAACKCVQELAFSGDVLAQKLVTMGVVPQLVYLMRDRNGTRHRAFATLRQGDRPQRRIVGPEELLQLTGFSLPLVSFSTKQRVVTLTPRGFSWSTFRARMPWRLQERSTVRREIRDVASEALQNICALRSGAKEMLACGACFLRSFRSALGKHCFLRSFRGALAHCGAFVVSCPRSPRTLGAWVGAPRC